MQAQRPKTKTISSNEAKQRWGSMIAAVADGTEIIVESHGKPKVAIISYEEFIRFKEDQEKRRRAELLDWLRDFGERQADRNSDLTEEEIENISIAVGREINARLSQNYRQRFTDQITSDPE